MKPRRSVMSIPGHIEKMHHKASLSGVDVPMLDLEDSVPIDKKDEARNLIIKSINEIDWQNKSVTYRINGLDTEFFYNDVIEVIENAGSKIDAVVIPKVNNVGDVLAISRLLDGIELRKGFKNKIGIEVSIESAEGLENISAIAKCDSRIKTIVFGIADFQASIGAKLISISGHGENEEDIYPGHRWNYVLSKIVTSAKANNLLAIDAAYGNFKDDIGLKKSAQISRALGCDGKWAIHPNQIETINRIFSPDKDEIARAKKIIEAHEQAISEGKGAVAIEGKMVDFATIRMAKKLWQEAGFLGLLK
ncbi:MAG: CoA ester lyase [Melioribacteraceae bacterium]|nr:CoA ester lyase [Melioribacteraceae bacterium]